jgi:hypothetical protein
LEVGSFEVRSKKPITLTTSKNLQAVSQGKTSCNAVKEGITLVDNYSSRCKMHRQQIKDELHPRG